MTAEKTGYTVSQHEKLGEELQVMYDRLQMIAVELCAAYPLRTRALNFASRAVLALYDLRSKMDDLVCKEQRGNKNIEPKKIYFRSSLEE